ncbi:LysM peptidoglycan-binding domain-containing protein [Demetria terragena]|uniref:LysM peptidoglycan-binding domain-containing protein n=1 Tax=Demetria terragena TaxID=63959 RepID=UPI000365AC11|nr:LysM peptidoglycan-binding domain-containing protein [Demetria terragena]
MSALAPVLDQPQALPRRRRHLALVSDVPARPTSTTLPAVAVRLTARGRRALLVTVLAIAILGGMAVSAWASGPTASEDVTVRPGQTLSDVARERLPELPLSAAIAHLQLANDLNSAQVSTGQRLQIPAP